jgi:hypothetical protein
MEVDALLSHRVDDRGIEGFSGRGAGRVHDDALCTDLASEASRHLGPAGVMNAEEEDLGTVGH